MDNKIFFNGDATGSCFFRIPFLLTTAQGTLIAGTDTNFGSTGDSAENIDTAIRRKPEAVKYLAGQGWKEAVIPEALHLRDYTDERIYQMKSASYIDGMIVQDRLGAGVKNRILLVIDGWAWNGGVLEHMDVKENGEVVGSIVRPVANGDGFAQIGGRKYLLLSSRNYKKEKYGKEKEINQNIDRSQFDYVADIYGAKDEKEQYPIYHLCGIPKPYPVTDKEPDDSNLSLGERSEYTLDENYDLYQKGIPLFVQQKGTEGKRVPMNVLYEESVLQVFNTSYLFQFYSDDDGITWKKDKIISSMVKRGSATAFLAGPGRGYQIQKGTFRGRLLFPVYYKVGNKLVPEIIYSEDGGESWKEGEAVQAEQGLSEGAIVELPNETLMLFMRNVDHNGKIMCAISDDGGIHWGKIKSALGDGEEGINCQLSAINYSKPVKSRKDNKEYPAILLASADKRSRKNGKIFVGLIKEKEQENSVKYEIDWEYQHEITDPNTLYAYNCLTELPDGRIGLLYETSDTEKWVDGLKAMHYSEFTIEELIAFSDVER